MLRKLQAAVSLGTRYTDILLAVAVVAVIGLMILPLPPAALDVLLACNLGLSTILLMMSMYIKGVLEFSTFPSMLLFTTLLRLSLSITATRLILLHAHAGQVIQTFGEFVVGGNLVVGAVIFLIITLVQFLVITKGAERVAEVAARFTLDAMPGKQMSVDADLRAGTIDMETAKLRRSNLERENQLYGAMDGAMKFVKGDAIAGLIITAVNIVGGLLIGMLQKGMPPEKALQTYSILTIGDGLVTQIPALLIAITAGMIVTRVSTEDSPALGTDMGGQLLGQPKALILGGCMLFLIAMIPGFPKPPFLVLGAIVLAVGYSLIRSAKDQKDGDEHPVPAIAPAGQKAPPPSKKSGDGGAEEFSLSVPLILDVPASIETTIDSRTLNEELIKVRRALYHDLGVPFPGIHLRFNEGMAEGVYRILLQEIPVAEGVLKADHVIAREHEDNLNVLGVPFVKERQFLPDVPALWVPKSQAPLLKQAGVQTLDLPQILTHHLAAILKKYAGDFLGLQETKFLLDNMEPRYAEVVKEAQRALPLQRIAEILQRLVQEQISVRNLRTVLQALIEWGQKEKDPVLLVEYVRSSLRRYISYKYSGGQNILAGYLLEPAVEETVRKAIRQTSSGSFLALDPAVTKKLVGNVRKQVGDLNRAGSKPVLLTAMDVRRYVRKLLETEVAELPVLSYQELTEEITIQPLAKIGL